MRTLSLTLGTSLLLSASALAGPGDVVADISYTPADNITMLRMVEPQGATCFVKNDAEKGRKTLTAPFALPVKPYMFYGLKCTLPGGETWAGKVEAKPNQLAQVKLHLDFPATPPTPAKQPAHAEHYQRTEVTPGDVALAANQMAAAQIQMANQLMGGHVVHHEPAAPAAPVAPPPPPEPQEMASGPFSALTMQVKQASFSSDKVNVIKAAARQNKFTVAQVGTLVDQATHSSDKVKIAQILRPSVIDPENGFQLQSHFTFSSDKKTIARLFQ